MTALSLVCSGFLPPPCPSAPPWPSSLLCWVPPLSLPCNACHFPASLPSLCPFPTHLRSHCPQPVFAALLGRGSFSFPWHDCTGILDTNPRTIFHQPAAGTHNGTRCEAALALAVAAKYGNHTHGSRAGSCWKEALSLLQL